MNEKRSAESYDSQDYRLDDLQCGFLLCQKKSDFCFGTDAVLLADFASKQIKKSAKTIDLCCGNGVVPILLHARRADLSIDGVEINAESCRLAEHNIILNRLKGQIRLIHSDLCTLPKYMYASYDAVTVNPPYIPVGKGLLSPQQQLNGARHEIHATLNDIIRISCLLLKEKGCLCMVHRTNRTAEIFHTLRGADLEPKSLRFVHKNSASKSNLMLICAVKHSGSWLDVLPPLILYEKDGTYTDELNAIYSRKECNETDSNKE